MDKVKHKILLLDGDHKNSLAIARHLGKTNLYTIDVVSYARFSMTFYSKFVNKKFIINNPKTDPDKYIKEILGLLNENKYLLIIPVSYISYQICSLNKTKILKKTHITIAEFDKIQLASSKIETYRLAQKIGIPYPEVTIVDNVDNLDLIQTQFPCVIKSPYEIGKNVVLYAQNKADLILKYNSILKDKSLNNTLPIIQKYISGEAAGFFAFYKNGKCVNFFMHKRIREYPVSGGASTCAESIYDEEIMINGKKILDYLKWEGVAMVEFKKDNTTNLFNLMEINAKFWGSLDLALVSGVNFPQMLVDDALNKEIEQSEYIKNVKFQWVLNGELFHILSKPQNFFKCIKDLIISKNDIYLTDLKPNIFQFFYIFVFYFKKYFK